MNAPDHSAGKQGECPKCGVAVVVPQIASRPTEHDPGYEVVADELAIAAPFQVSPEPSLTSDVAPPRKDGGKSKSKKVEDPLMWLWVGAGGGAAFAVVVAIGILLPHSQGKSNPGTINWPEQSAATPEAAQNPPGEAQSEPAQAPDLADLSAKASLPDYFRPDVAVSLSVGVADPRVEVILLEGPSRAKIENGVLVWTPRRADVGRGKITLRYAADGERQDRSFSYVVSEIPVVLPVRVTGMAASPDGQLLLIWGVADHTATDKPQFQLVVVDVPSRSIKAQRTIAPGHNVVLSSEYAIVRSGQTMLTAYRLSDLEQVSQARLFRDTEGMKVIADRVLWVEGGSLMLPDMSEPVVANSFADGTEIRRLRDGWLAGPAVLDEAMREVRFFHQFSSRWFRSAPIMSVIPNATEGLGETAPRQVPYSADRWSDGRTWNHELDTPGAPGRIEFLVNPSTRGSPRIELISAVAPGGAMPFACATRGPTTHDNVHAAALGEVVAVWVGNELFLTNLAAVRKELAPAVASDLSVRPAPNQFLLASEGKTPVRYLVSGGKPPYQIRCDVVTGQLEKPTSSAPVPTSLNS